MGQGVVRCSVLGQAEIAMPGIRLTPESERQYGLALFFCVNAGRGVPRDEVAQMFWPEHELEAARHCLRQMLYRVRALGVPVRSGARTSTLDAGCVETDYLAAAAEDASASVYLALSDVTVLPGYTPRFSAPFEEWVERFRSDLGARIRRGLVRAIADARSRGRYGDVERLARQCLTLDPLNEEATLALAEAVALVGGKVEAVGMIDRYVGEVGGHPDLRISAEILRARVSELLASNNESFWGRSLLVGREPETEQLLALFAQSRHGLPQFVCLTGEAGVGKTALGNHLMRLIALRDCNVVRVSCQRLDRGRPLAVLTQIVSSLFRIRGALGASAETLSILRALTSWDSLDSREQQQERPQLQVSQIQSAFEDLVDALVHEAPLAILVDDIHWIDARSLASLTSVSASDHSRSLMLVACARPHLGHIAAQLSPHSSHQIQLIRVLPLKPADSALLMRHAVGPDGEAINEADVREYVSISGGNPLFLIQLARHVRQVRGSELRPDSLRSLVYTRLQTLDSQSLLTLQACSCLGTYASLGRLEGVLQLPGHQLLRSLALLHGAGMIRMDDDSLQCRHELFAEVAKASTPPSVATLLHSRAARVMERDAQASGDPMLLWQSAEHCEMARQSSDARRVLTKLGNYLMRIGTPTDASRAYERAMTYCESWEQRLGLTNSLLQAHRASRNWAAIIRTVEQRRQLQLQRGLTLPREPSVQLMELEARARLSDDMRSELTLIMEQLGSDTYERSERSALVLMGLIMSDNLLDSRAASRLMSFLPTLSDSASVDDLSVSAQLVFHTTFGCLNSAVAHARTIQTAYNTSTLPDVRGIQRLRWSAMPLLYAGLVDDCERVLALAVSEARRRFLWTEAASAAGLLAEVALQRSDLHAARRRLAEARSYVSRTTDEELLADMRGYSATIALLSGDLAAARSELAESGPHNSPRPERRVRARALSLKLAVNHADNRAPDADIDELVSLASGVTEYGDFDLIVCILLRLLAQRSDLATRRALLARYRCNRRERYPIPDLYLATFCPELSA